MLDCSRPMPGSETIPLTAADFAQKSRNLFADATVPSFFRRPSFSPDGALFVAPTGIYRNLSSLQQTFCTHVFSRTLMTSPIMSLVGLEDPSVVIRFSPVLFKLICTSSEEKPYSIVPGKYR